MLNDLVFWKVATATQPATLLLMVMFLARPEIDLYFSTLFFLDGRGFALADDPAALVVRDVFRFATDTAAVVVAALLAHAVLAPGRVAVPARHWGFLAAVLALGPWLAANELLKDNWGRARPADVEAFGGTADFAPPFLMSDGCDRNCSFVSGEATAAAALTLGPGVLLWASFSPARRLWMIAAFAAPACAASGLRIAMGRHFLSDVIFGWLLAALVVVTVYPLFGIGASRDRFTLRHVALDATTLARAAHAALGRVSHRLLRLMRA